MCVLGVVVCVGEGSRSYRGQLCLCSIQSVFKFVFFGVPSAASEALLHYSHLVLLGMLQLGHLYTHTYARTHTHACMHACNTHAYEHAP